MVDHARLSGVLSDFAHTLVRNYEVGDVLYQLTDATVEVLGTAGAGVSLMEEGGELRFVSATDEDTSKVERVQEACQLGPCKEAHELGETVLVHDIASDHRWPKYREQAMAVGFQTMAGIPMRLQDFRLGALNIYDKSVRNWGDDDVVAAQALADMASSLVINARELAQSRRVAEQLQHALESRVIIEQAKGAVARDMGISIDEAFGILRDHARANRTKLHDVARAVVDNTLRLG